MMIVGCCLFVGRLLHDCIDGSDESDSYSRCEACTEEGFVPCPGFPGNCGKLCDGNVTCPDKYHLESRNAHPCNVHSSFVGFYDYLASKGYDLNAVAFNLRKTIGHHRLAHMALKGPPNFVDKKVFEIGKWLMELQTKSKVYHFILNSVRAIQTSRHPFLLNLD